VPVFIETDHLAVEHGGTYAQRRPQLAREGRELREAVAVARYELGAVAAHVRERTEAVVLELEEPRGIVERLPDERRGHRPELAGHDR